MKNIGSKILILGFVIAVAVAGVLVFYPTIVKPPVDVAMNNPHTANAEATIGDFVENVNDIAHNDSLFYAMVDKLEVYRLEKYLTEDELDKQTLSLVRSYVPIFRKWCNSKFGESSWNAKEDHPRMKQRIADIRALTNGPENEPVTAVSETIGPENERVTAVSDAHEDDLKYVEKVIGDYKKATEVAKSSSFVSVAKAKNTIEEADRYYNTEPLDNCKDLRTKLSEVKVKIGNSHYAKVEAKVEELALYCYKTEDSFNALKETAKSMIEEYDSNRYIYGSSAKTSDDLWRKYNSYIKFIDINRNYEWEYIDSPDSSYRALQSYYNRGRDGYNATMYFDISGYEEFTFYIRSYGETNYDYVKVCKVLKTNSIGSYPPASSYYSDSTYGKSTSGTSIYSYTPVTYTDLDRNQTYRIYVVYQKDNTNSYNDDRGYVLIPYAN